MNDNDRLALETQLASLKDRYPNLQSEGKGLFRKAIGWGDIANVNLLPDDFHYDELTIDECLEMPACGEDPLSALAAERLFHSDSHGGGLRPPRSMEELKAMRFQPAGFLELRKKCVIENAALLRQSGRTAGNSVIQKRSRCYRRVLWAEAWHGPDRIKSAQADVTVRKKTILVHGKPLKIRFPKNWRTTLIDRRLGIELQIDAGKMARVQKAYRRLAGRQARSEKGDFGDRKKDRKAGRRREAAQLINTYPAPNELCYHQVADQIIHEVVRRREDPIYLVLALAIATLSQPSSLLRDDFIEPSEVNGVFYSARAVRKLHRGPKYDLDGYESASSEIPIFWPPAPTRDFLELRKRGESHVKSQDLDLALRRLCPMASWDKLLRTLVRHGTAWFHMPWLWAVSAAYPRRKKPAPSHYTLLGSIQYQRLLPFIRLFDPSVVLPEDVLKGLAFGSKWVLKLERVQSFAQSWLRLLTQPPPTDFWDALCAWNVLAGGAYDLSRLFGGLRAGPIPPPTCIQLNVRPSVTILRQKRLVLAYHSEVFRQFWPLLLDRHDELRSLAKAAGVIVDSGDFGDAIYCHYVLGRRSDGTPRLRPVIPNHHNTAEAYSCHSSFHQFCMWWPAWPRHLSNSYLRDLGYPEIAVQRFHFHAPSTLEPLHWDQASPALDFALNEKASQDLCNLLFHA